VIALKQFSEGFSNRLEFTTLNGREDSSWQLYESAGIQL
jgi:hypothetical protein